MFSLRIVIAVLASMLVMSHALPAQRSSTSAPAPGNVQRPARSADLKTAASAGYGYGYGYGYPYGGYGWGGSYGYPLYGYHGGLYHGGYPFYGGYGGYGLYGGYPFWH